MTDVRPAPQPRRNRIFSLLTLIAAIGSGWSTIQIADYVKHINTARLVGAAMTGRLFVSSPQQQRGRDPLPGLPFIPLSSLPANSIADKTGTQPTQAEQIEDQMLYVEGAVFAWQCMMYGSSGGLGLIAAVSFVTRKARLLHLIAAVAILITTVGTVVGMMLLVDPLKGGFPPLPIRSYVYVAAVQSSYGLVLLMAFMRKPKPASNGIDD